MDLLGALALGLMGMTLGLMGAGGSILTIPILVYILGFPIVLATSYSLVVVGTTAFIASLRYGHQSRFKKSIPFLIPSVFGVFGARHFIIPNLPQRLGTLSLDTALFILLLIFMGFAGHFMIKNGSVPSGRSPPAHQTIKVIPVSLSLGIMMGMLGAGGGFLIIPTLLFLMGFSMKEAVPTSLVIITINSFIGFVSDHHHFMTSDWINLATYLAYSLLGMAIGLYSAQYIKGESLKKAFGYFIWSVAITLLIKELIL